MSSDEHNLEILEIRPEGIRDGAGQIRFITDDGENVGRYHAAPQGTPAVLWVFGAGGGLGGPAGGLYERLARQLAPNEFASLQLDYRRPGHMASCALDVLGGIEYLRALQHTPVVLIGHSFGGAVVIAASAGNEDVAGVVALSSQTQGAGMVGEVSPHPLLLMHGEADEVLPATCSRVLYQNAREPKTLKLYPGCGHGLDGCRDAVDRDLLAWLREVRKRIDSRAA